MSGTERGGRPRPPATEADRPARPEDELDEGLEETFPASDPPALGGPTGPDEAKK
jgi:hypothetical protein